MDGGSGTARPAIYSVEEYTMPQSLGTPARQAATAVAVTEYPALAPQVHLLGEMQGTGFKDRQWLIQRDSQFIQLTELLYRVAEQANGERTLEEIAAGVTAATEWLVSADNVRQILQAKLIPLGLIATALRDDVPGASAAATATERPRSPLALNLRMKVIGPGAIEPFTRVLQFLYAPPLLIPLLVVIAVAHWWLYVRHTVLVLGGLLELLYTPWLVLVLLAILLVSGVFHEFGHASALRYGGGKVRGMGVGLYLIYPAFYTDVTDSYRLGRWARVRTDLGGFYFHLIFALGLITVAVVSEQPFLYFAVLLITLDILRQCIPFGRFDGYWALADLTGVPDFLSQIGAFLRSVLPIPGLSGGKLPGLKPWVKVIFALYILATVPVFAFFLFLMVKGLPTLAATTWDAVLIQQEEFFHPQRYRGAVGKVLSVLQLALAVLPLLATLYLLYNSARLPLRGLWQWSKHSVSRALAGGGAVAAVLALVAYLWVPQLPFVVRPVPVGVQTFAIMERAHVEPPVLYAQSPPVGGDHAPIWQNCGFYSTPIANENAVHAMEHGVVWITYHPDLPTDQVNVLRRLAERQTHVLVTPYPELPASVVASAWNRQLPLDSATDPRLGQFVRAFRLGSQAPERGGPCSGGVGAQNWEGATGATPAAPEATADANPVMPPPTGSIPPGTNVPQAPSAQSTATTSLPSPVVGAGKVFIVSSQGTGVNLRRTPSRAGEALGVYSDGTRLGPCARLC